MENDTIKIRRHVIKCITIISHLDIHSEEDQNVIHADTHLGSFNGEQSLQL